MKYEIVHKETNTKILEGKDFRDLKEELLASAIEYELSENLFTTSLDRNLRFLEEKHLGEILRHYGLEVRIYG